MPEWKDANDAIESLWKQHPEAIVATRAPGLATNRVTRGCSKPRRLPQAGQSVVARVCRWCCNTLPKAPMLTLPARKDGWRSPAG